MIPYLIFYSFLGIFGFLSTLYERRKKTFFILCALLLIAIIGFRSITMGVDLGYHYAGQNNGYLQSFSSINKMEWKNILSLDKWMNYEPGYIVFNKLIGTINSNQHFFLFVCAVFSLAPVFCLYYHETDHPFLAILIYLSTMVFHICFSGLRQAIAIGICCISFLFIKNKKVLPFVLFVLLAWLFHSSSIIFLLAYPLYYFKPSKNIRLISVLILLITFLFRSQIYNFLVSIFNIDRGVDNNGSFGFFIFLTLIYTVCFIVDNKNNYLNLLFVACFIQSMAGMNTIAMRYGYYFLVFMPLSICEFLNIKLEEKTKKLMVTGLIIFFAIYGLYTIYNSSWSCAYPYIPFWRD